MTESRETSPGPLHPLAREPRTDARRGHRDPHRTASTAVAVSGGPDSLALALLTQKAAEAVGRPDVVLALTVDHGLRPESGAEAQRVNRWLAARGIEHRVLSIAWGEAGPPPPGSAVMERARLARYATLAAACETAGCDTLLVGQHADDQAETLLLRLGMGSAIDGLAGMRPAIAMPVPRATAAPTASLSIVRPLLGVRKVWIAAALVRTRPGVAAERPALTTGPPPRANEPQSRARPPSRPTCALNTWNGWWTRATRAACASGTASDKHWPPSQSCAQL